MKSLKIIIFGFILVFIIGTIPVKSVKKQPKIAAITTKSIIAEADTYVDMSNPLSNFGGQDWLYSGVGIFDVPQEAYFRFSFSGKPNNWKKAEISLNFWSVSQTINLTVCLINDTWEEFTMDWMNKPEHREVIGYFFLTTSKRYNIDISDYVNGRNNISICVYIEIINYVDDYVIIDSREEDLGYSWYGEDNPKLIWTYISEDGNDDDDNDDDDFDFDFESINGYDFLILSGSLIGIITILIIRKKVHKT